jgi:hypothetical protein
MKPKVFEPLQMTPEEFRARLEADRHVRAARQERGSGGAGTTPDRGGA